MSDLYVSYDREEDSLRITTENTGMDATSLDPQWWVVLDLAAEKGVCNVVGLEVLSASTYLPLGKRGYDHEADVLLLGTKDGATTILENGDLVVYWKPDPEDSSPDECTPVGVEVRSAKKWLMGQVEHDLGSRLPRRWAQSA